MKHEIYLIDSFDSLLCSEPSPKEKESIKRMMEKLKSLAKEYRIKVIRDHNIKENVEVS